MVHQLTSLKTVLIQSKNLIEQLEDEIQGWQISYEQASPEHHVRFSETCQILWERLRGSILSVGDMIDGPPIGFGLCALWLRVIRRKMSEAIREMESGGSDYEDFFHGASESLKWMLNHAEYLGRRTLRAESITPGLFPMDRDNLRSSVIEQLRNLQQRTVEEYGAAVDRKQANHAVQKSFLEAGGILILGFVNHELVFSDALFDDLILQGIGQNYEGIDPAIFILLLAEYWLPTRSSNNASGEVQSWQFLNFGEDLKDLQCLKNGLVSDCMFELANRLEAANIAARATVHVESPTTDNRSSNLSGFMGGKELMDSLGVHPTQRNACFQQLGRKRPEIGDTNWCEISEPHPNSPRYLYRADAETVLQIAEKYKSPRSS